LNLDSEKLGSLGGGKSKLSGIIDVTVMGTSKNTAPHGYVVKS
jgi:hypothetical protein